MLFYLPHVHRCPSEGIDRNRRVCKIKYKFYKFQRVLPIYINKEKIPIFSQYLFIIYTIKILPRRRIYAVVDVGGGSTVFIPLEPEGVSAVGEPIVHRGGTVVAILEVDLIGVASVA